jgi:glutamine amidotransferase
LIFKFLDSAGILPYYDRGNAVALFYLMTMPISVVIVDYGAGNLRSVVNALRLLDCDPLLSSNREDISGADAIVLPGVGAARAAMNELNLKGLVEPIKYHVSEGKPLLGVCLGLQLLLTDTEEGGMGPCMGLIPGRVKLISDHVKIPHMGWNQVKQVRAHAIFSGIPDDSNFYFVHSYYAAPKDESVVSGTTDYGTTFCSVLTRGNLVATQFHPEKSGEMGLKFYDNFIKLASEATRC